MIGDRGETGLLMRLLQATTLRSKVVAGNISNQSTPGYKRKVVHFEELLQEAARKGLPAGEVQPEIVVDTDTPARPDGNNVVPELEMEALRENRLLYETYISILESHFDLIEASIQSGR